MEILTNKIFLVGLFFTVYLIIRVGWWIFLQFSSRLPIILSRYRNKAVGKDGSWALITGSTDGIGLGFANVLARHGFNLVLVSRSREKLEKVKCDIGKRWTEIKLKTIVSEASDLSSENFNNIVNEVKDLDLSLIVNNVGIIQALKPVDQLDPEFIQRIINVNCTYPSLLTHHLVPILLRHTSGRKGIINLSSITALNSLPLLGVYCGSKAFNRAFSNSIAADYSSVGIDVLAVNSGVVATKMTNMKESLICPSPEQCAEDSLKRLGMTVETIPHPKHIPLWFFMALSEFLMPSILIAKIMGNKTLTRIMY